MISTLSLGVSMLTVLMLVCSTIACVLDGNNAKQMRIAV